ncbi:DnaD domain protein [Clostridium ihumii]|uniref:DnaD domain protein n=1 Tax=Clostridium ihumii TaxID=1470356 RepID=UPI003D33FB11
MFSISNFNQLESKKLGVSLDDLLILNYIKTGVDNLTLFSKVINKEKYYWIDYEKVIDTFPILNIKKDTLYRKLKKLCVSKVLKHTTVKSGGTYSFYTFGENFEKILNVSNNYPQNKDKFTTNVDRNSYTVDNSKNSKKVTNKNVKNIDSNSDNTALNVQNPNFNLASEHNGIFSEYIKSQPDFTDLYNCESKENPLASELISKVIGDNSLTKYIYNILNNIKMLFNNISKSNYINSINRINNNNNCSNNNSLDNDFNPDNLDVYNYYTECGLGTLNNTAINLINTLVNKHGIESLKKAMTEAVRQNSPKLSYVEGILKNWENKNKKPVKTQVPTDTSTQTPTKSKDSFNNFEQRKYDFKELEWDLLGWNNL